MMKMLKEGNLTGPLVIRAVFVVDSAVSWQQRPYPCCSVAIVPLMLVSQFPPFLPLSISPNPPSFSVPSFQLLPPNSYHQANHTYIHTGK